MTSPLAESVAEEVRAQLARRRMSATKLAAQLGISHAYLSRRLTGGVAFDVTDLERIAAALDIPVSTFMPERSSAA